MLLRVLGDAAECCLGLLLQAQGVAVEDAPGVMPGDGHGLMRGYVRIDQVGEGGVPRVVEDKPPAFLPTGKPAFLQAVAHARLKSPTQAWAFDGWCQRMHRLPWKR